MHELWVYYRGDHAAKIGRLTKPGLCFGGGTDLRSGERDVSFWFRTARGAKGAAARIKAALGRKVRVKVHLDD